MMEPTRDDPAFRRFNAIVTLVLAATVAGVAYVYERKRVRWWGENRPSAGAIQGIDRTRQRVGRVSGNMRDVSTTMGAVSAASRPRVDADGQPQPGSPGGAALIRTGVAGTVAAARSREDIRRSARIRAQAERQANVAKRRTVRG